MLLKVFRIFDWIFSHGSIPPASPYARDTVAFPNTLSSEEHVIVGYLTLSKVSQCLISIRKYVIVGYLVRRRVNVQANSIL